MHQPLIILKSHRRVARWYWLFATGWFMAAILMGWGLRMALSGFGYEDMVFSNWRHAHSHVAFLGWMYNALLGLTLWVFPLKENHRWHLRWMIIAQIAVAGMALSFPWQGYGAVSIFFSSLHMVASFGVFYRLVKDRPRFLSPATRQAFHVMYAALLCMLLSGLGPLALGPLAAMDMQGSIPYRLAIYVYLHFQYNGWFILQALAIWLMQRSFQASIPTLPGIPMIVAGTLLTYAQSTLWSTDNFVVWAAAGIGGILQLLGWGQLILSARQHGKAIQWNRWGDISMVVATIALSMKLLLQLGIVLPSGASIAHQHQVVIAFLHLVFLGILTPFVWGRVEVFRIVTTSAGKERWAAYLFLVSFGLLEIVQILPALGVYGWPWSKLVLGLTTIISISLITGMIGLQRKLIEHGQQ